MNTGFIDTPSFVNTRDQFLTAAHAAGARLSEYTHPLTGPWGERLVTDVALLGSPDASKQLVIISGTHGVEGYYGSACQRLWLRELTNADLPDDVSILMVHLINPWGTAWLRRVNEDNVDINRNYINFDSGLPLNKSYSQVHELYTCPYFDGPVRRKADEALLTQINAMGWSAFMGIVGAGQYDHADGMFFGGQEESWSNRTLHTIIAEHGSKADTVICFDLHTGAGSFGHPMLMAIAESSYPALQDAQKLFGPWLYTLLTGQGQSSDTGVVASATGYTSQALLQSRPDAHFMPMVIECGTYDQARGHQVVRDDNWLHLYGDPLDATGRQIKQALLEHFLPGDPDWLDLAWFRSKQIFNKALLSLGQRE